MKQKKIVLARELRLELKNKAEISAIIDKLIKTQATSYIFAFENGNDCFIGATPERLVKLEKNQLLSTCLAGTAPRGNTKEEDTRIGISLLDDEKNREEHDFVVKMIKRAINDYCTDIDIPGKPVIYPLKNLQHLFTPVIAKLKDKYSIFDIVRELHPTPALGGTPTEESLAFIREHEQLDRGWYGAPIGWLDSNQNSEFAVAIRSGLIKGDKASLFAGCGVVKDSDIEAEYEETNIKFLPMLSVLGG
ncbi:isochorismate synthase [Virgibacillus alimentarius]|uniref:isochorismate synthase n=1 Tax=Virgibacillus alimentarius TaxID=698769 RepID=UPI001CF7A1C7|nr:isochorismate synthase [Virgibacillus alimentarius]